MFGITTLAATTTALVLAATLVIPGTGPGPGIIPGAESGANHVVAADGSGDFTTISEAVAAAAEGDTVLVKPGRYVEVVVIDKDITLKGDGPREDVLITYPTGSPPTEVDPDGNPFYALLKVQEADAAVSSLSLSGAAPEGGETSVSLLVAGGAPLLEDLYIVGSQGALPIVFRGQSAPVLRDSAWSGLLYTTESSAPTIEGNTINAYAELESGVLLNGPAEVTVRGNTLIGWAPITASGELTGVIEGNDFTNGWITVNTGSDMVVRDNIFRSTVSAEDAGLPAIGVIDSGSNGQVVGNTVTGMGYGISVTGGAEATVEGNELTDNVVGVVWSSLSGGTLDGNAISGGMTGIQVTGGSPSIVGNTVEGASRAGISIGRDATPSLSGNTVCGSETNLYLSAGAAPEMGEGNDICPDGAAE